MSDVPLNRELSLARWFTISPAEIASEIAAEPLPNHDPSVWGVLTAISDKARKRPQGIHMLLSSSEHQIGRCIRDHQFHIENKSVSAKHCNIYRKCASVYLQDTSTNGTFLNWERLKKAGPAENVHHGDLISLCAPPHHGAAFTFVFREVSSTPGVCGKRKTEEFVGKNKRLKGMGIGAPEGPIYLYDFQNLQRSNTELRKQLESQAITIDNFCSVYRLAVEHYENEKKDLKELVAKPYLDQLKEMHCILEGKQKEVVEINKICAEQKHALEDLNERLTAFVQSSTANEVMNIQKASLADLKAQLDEEHQRGGEQEKAAADLKPAVHKAQSDAQEELKQVSDAATRREREQQEVINKLQAAQEEAWVKVSALELEMNSVMQDLDFERRKLKAARERIMLWETQLRAFYSTTEEISVMFAKQQEQLKSMQRTLEDKENYENTYCQGSVSNSGTEGSDNKANRYSNYNTAKAGSATTPQRSDGNQVGTSSEEVGVTEKLDCDIRSQEDAN